MHKICHSCCERKHIGTVYSMPSGVLVYLCALMLYCNLPRSSLKTGIVEKPVTAKTASRRMGAPIRMSTWARSFRSHDPVFAMSI